ncbi:cytochrome P450 [Streptomyces sp. NPDC088560]|uniref:cytochrome P450 n=1 Tax=Streptomyces sp. NPDC088560 TaxID=3365868 RepID=UPI003804BD02
MPADADTEVLRRTGRIVVVGVSLAGLRAAETLREKGFTGSLTMIGDEPYEPYDRPPLSKQALLGRARPEDTALPRRRDIDADWRLGVAAESLDRDARQVRLAEKGQRARQDLGAYLAGLIETKRRHPGPGILSTLAPDMTPADLEATAVLLLVAGHETTVNAITNTTLTLLRHPDVLQRFQKEPDLTVPLNEEVLRYEPPVQFVTWTTDLADIDVAGTTIPKGSPVWLMLAAANRDPRRFEGPDRFDPDRKDNEHLGFYTGIHYCFGAPLARIELHLAVAELFRRVTFSGLLEDPPPYRTNAVLRGPRHLPVAIEGLTA